MVLKNKTVFIFSYFVNCFSDRSQEIGYEIYEPFCGEGHISKFFKEHGFKVIEYDLYSDYATQKVDYTKSLDPPYGFLVTNPSYAPEVKWPSIEKAALSGKPYAMLLSMNILGSIIGSKIFEQYPVSIYMFRRGLKFERPDGSTVVFTNMAWFVGNVETNPLAGVIDIRYIDTCSEEENSHESFSIVGQDLDEF